MKHNKFLKFISLIFLTIFFVSSCTKTPGYIVTWKNYDGTILEIDEDVKKDTIPTYDNKTPVRDADLEYIYTFIGWYKEGDSEQTLVDLKTYTINSDITFIAKYESHTYDYYSFTYTLNSEKNGYIISDYREINENVSVPSTYNNLPIVGIGDGTFYNCSFLISIDIPDSVTSIGESAFYGCSSLTSIDIPNSVITIGSRAFYECSSLKSIVLSDNLTTIDELTFAGCSSLISIDIPNDVTTIDVGAFMGCTSLISIFIPDSVTIIGDNTFSYCSSLTSITIPNHLTIISNSVFSYCSSLKSVVIPNSVTIIDDSAFYYCTSLSYIFIPNSVTNIGSWAFYNCSSLTSIFIPDSVTFVGVSVFYYCDLLTIYCEVTSQPNGWNIHWNLNHLPVVWDSSEIDATSE